MLQIVGEPALQKNRIKFNVNTTQWEAAFDDELHSFACLSVPAACERFFLLKTVMIDPSRDRNCSDLAIIDSTFTKCLRSFSVPLNNSYAEKVCIDIGGHLPSVHTPLMNNDLFGVFS